MRSVGIHPSPMHLDSARRYASIGDSEEAMEEEEEEEGPVEDYHGDETMSRARVALRNVDGWVVYRTTHSQPLQVTERREIEPAQCA
eukprot:CAMPEP_0174365208 /NCGR_PEP_ID=MMETSP0811_2-20130205/76287_1 /TAXON_ID=73025 ORGANISM="Eutreptiella gymnastica-like, Strain CCMP1594" /NCGR_SAMPLE_ID=MMETSP0811_2 /ASSEMBLY_ACC=CAM_ASM_000667 /LENGTH=86 /DNA_ID=CAMNT_0015505629 /DNA_START=495 /DNA_END=752 /DNA_ORIENTATION=-